MTNAANGIIRGGEALAYQSMLPDEKIVFTGRSHRLFLIMSVTLPSLLFIVSIIIGAYIAVVTILRSGYVAGISLSLLIAPALGVIVAIIWLAIAYSGWENRKLILTTKRVIVTRRSLRLFEEYREIELNQIRDVKVTIPEPLAKALGYAHLVITISNSQLSFTHLAEAKQVKDIIDRARKAETGSPGDNQA